MGTSGEDAALRLAGAGLHVVGIEANLIGGECPYWACLPTKSLVRSANLVAEARRADGLVGTVTVDPNWTIIAERIRAEITGGWDDSGGVSRFEAKGGTFVRGMGRLIGPRAIQVGDATIRARIGILVATGSTPSVPPIDGLRDLPFWTNHEAIASEHLPKQLVVLGGGAVGCELAQVFARFGSQVAIIEGADRILAHGEPEASGVVADALVDDGVRIITSHHARSVAGDEETVSVTLDDGTVVTGSNLLVATGRRADADAIGASAADAVVERGRIVVDGRMRAADGLWAMGDVTGVGMLTSVAEYQARIAVEDILGAEPRPADYTANPTVTFTDPEVGSVGLTEAAAREAGFELEVQVKDIQATFRGWLHRTGNTGVIKLVVDASSRTLVGATIVGPSASEAIAFLSLAVSKQMTVDDLVNEIYAFPTFVGGIGESVGAYGRGIARVLDPATPPLMDDPPSSR